MTDAIRALFHTSVDADELPEEDRESTGPHHMVPGRCVRYRFPNGRGASVIPRGDVWELGVLGADGHLDYSTPVADDVVRGDAAMMAELLAAIKALP